MMKRMMDRYLGQPAMILFIHLPVWYPGASHLNLGVEVGGCVFHSGGMKRHMGLTVHLRF